ncbi:hypothetical protein ACJMK2_033890 [Sinanodonta woodiana]|uniref:Cadherin domain-containing protein n=1 Tax=Sinanodonta woodiana TaxID=1069815 RepID=A0ABD3WRB4_SINWO
MKSSVLPQYSSINSSISTTKPMLQPGHNNIVLPPAYPGPGFLNSSFVRDSCDALTKRIPHTIVFNETEAAGTVFFRLRTVENFTLDVTITEPFGVTSVLSGYLMFQKISDSYTFTLSRQIDIEDVYELTGRGVRLSTMTVTVKCKRQVMVLWTMAMDDGEATINVTVLDVDDTPPSFVYQGDTKTCAVPVYSADASEHYMGLLEIKPGKIEAVDGDVFEQNNISYTVMHAEPANYDLYFSLDSSTGNVNKTKRMEAADPRKYVLFVRAFEDSVQKLNRVAILSIQVFAPSNPFKDDTPAVNPVVMCMLQILSILLFLSFLVGFIVILYHRMKITTQTKVSNKENNDDDNAEDTQTGPIIAVYQGSKSSLDSKCSNEKENTNLSLRNRASISTPSHVMFSEKP